MVSKKLKNFVYLLLIVQNSFYANCIDCMYGIKVGETDGWGDPPKGKVKVGEPCDYSCLRLEIDEIKDPNGEMIKNVVGFGCAADCEILYENAEQPKLKSQTANTLSGMVGDNFGLDMSDVRASCCDTTDCNDIPIEKPTVKPEPETSAGIKIAASLSLPVVFIVALFY